MLRRSSNSTSGRILSWLSCSTILLLLLAGLPALATEPVVVPLLKGEPAPYSGMLYSVNRAVRMGKRVERCDFLIAQEQKKTKELLDDEQARCDELMTVNDNASEMREAVLQNQPAPWWVAGLGYVAGVATVVLGAWAVGQVVK